MTRPVDARPVAPERGVRLTPVTTGRGRPRLWMESDARSREPDPDAARPQQRGIEAPDSLVQKERKAAWEEIGRALDAIEAGAQGAGLDERIRTAS